jgi:putative exporter of polyketide antibiotics
MIKVQNTWIILQVEHFILYIGKYPVNKGNFVKELLKFLSYGYTSNVDNFKQPDSHVLWLLMIEIKFTTITNMSYAPFDMQRSNVHVVNASCI